VDSIQEERDKLARLRELILREEQKPRVLRLLKLAQTDSHVVQTVLDALEGGADMESIERDLRLLAEIRISWTDRLVGVFRNPKLRKAEAKFRNRMRREVIRCLGASLTEMIERKRRFQDAEAIFDFKLEVLTLKREVKSMRLSREKQAQIFKKGFKVYLKHLRAKMKVNAAEAERDQALIQ
jgi:hypothetical protein